jgi:hypothetical protein
MVHEPGLGYNQSYYIPEEKEILEVVNAKFNPYLEPITKLDLVSSSSLSSPKSGAGSSKNSDSGASKTSGSGGTEKSDGQDKPVATEPESPKDGEQVQNPPDDGQGLTDREEPENEEQDGTADTGEDPKEPEQTVQIVTPKPEDAEEADDGGISEDLE